jgi:hypothetical protein
MSVVGAVYTGFESGNNFSLFGVELRAAMK